MLRIAARLSRSFSTGYRPPAADFDAANMAGLIRASDQASLTFMEKLSTFRPSNMYHAVDEFSREALFTLANDYRLGLPLAIVGMSLIIKGIFFYPNVKGQAMAMKMAEIKPFMERYKEKARIAQMTGNKALSVEAAKQFKEVRIKKGIDNFYNLINMIQLPFLITWFLSLRYVTAMPEIFPETMEPFLWMDNICSYDPYFIFPLVSACLSSYSIMLSPALNRNVAMPILQPFIKYMKFMPFLSLPITGFFPAALNIYWCTLAATQVGLMTCVNSEAFRKSMGLGKQEKVSQVVRAAYVEQKPTTKSQQKLEEPPTITPNAEKVTVVSHRAKKGSKPKPAAK